MAEHGGGGLGIGISAAPQEPVGDVASGGRERPSGLIPERSGVQACIQHPDGPGAFTGDLDQDGDGVSASRDRAYRRLRNFACVGSTQKREVMLYLAVNPNEVYLVPGFTRDVSGIGHHRTGSLEVRLRSEKDLERAGNPFQLSYSTA